MAQSRFAQAKTFDTTNLGGQGGPSLQDATPCYTSFTITNNPTNVTPQGFGSITRKIYRFAAISVSDTTIPGDTTGPNIWTDDYLNT